MWLDEVNLGKPERASRYPFSFVYDGVPSEDLLPKWPHKEQIEEREDHCTRHKTVWTDPDTGLRVKWELAVYHDFPACDWTVSFKNTSRTETPVIQDVKMLDLVVGSPLSPDTPFRVHSMRGGIPNPTQFEPRVQTLHDGGALTLDAGAGRSSNKHMPFFTFESADFAVVTAIEWSGWWRADFTCRDDTLAVQAGMDRTHFLLHAGEKVSGPRMLVLHGDAGIDDALAQFRQLIAEHYAPKRPNEDRPSPIFFTNTCFTRNGHWLNETTAENQASLIRAYGGLGAEAVITDAGWMEGGWPNGVGSWTVRPDHYPEGMAPLAQTARDEGTVYGLWFEPERVAAGSWLHENRPDWLLRRKGDESTFMLDFGLREVQDYFFGLVEDFMDLPGFRVYRTDFNRDPAPYWRENDAPHRQGITEIRYIEGLYTYWDHIRRAWPDVIMENCASGGRRIDLGTIKRFHTHQKSDYWFDAETDQASLLALNRYLPASCIAAHVRDLDDYAWHSVFASSICAGWIADAEDFDAGRAKELLGQYREWRHLLQGACFALTPYPYSFTGVDTPEAQLGGWQPWQRASFESPHGQWAATQFHREDLQEGLLLFFRRPNCLARTIEVRLHGLAPGASYRIEWTGQGETAEATGAELMERLEATLTTPRSSALVHYKKV